MMYFDVLEPRRLLAAQYSLTLLTPATGASASFAYALNEAGQVVGYSEAGSTDKPMLWNGASATTLPVADDGDSVAVGINESGTILYRRHTRSSGGTFTRLFFRGLSNGLANSINDGGVVVGQLGYDPKATIWETAEELVTIPTGYEATAWDINNDGVVVGSSGENDTALPFIYINKQTKQLPVPASAKPFAEARSINTSGDIAGYITLDTGKKRAVIWENNLMKDLSALAGADQTFALSINDSGVVVGGGSVAFLYSGGVMKDLNTLVNLPGGVKLIEAWDINNKGQIVGIADTPGGKRGFLLKSFGTSTIAGAVYNDTDADGVKDSGEKGIAGVKVYLDADKDGVLDNGEVTAVTDSSGNYKFGSLASGSYRVRQASVAGYRLTNPTAGYFDQTVSGQNITGKNFGNTQKVLISGTLWKDADGDGLKDAGETGLSGWRVFIDKDKDGIYDSGENNVLTDASGNYSFKQLGAGFYRVRAVVQSNWRRTAPGSGYYDLNLASGATSTGRNFGHTQNVLISGNVFNDLDKDKIKDAGEKGLSGWRVFIDKDNDGVFDTGENSLLTDSSGNWTFRALAAGTYVVRVVTQSGWTRTTTSGFYTITLAAAASSTGRNFGFAAV